MSRDLVLGIERLYGYGWLEIGKITPKEVIRHFGLEVRRPRLVGDIRRANLQRSLMRQPLFT